MKKTVFKNALLVTPESVTEGDLACSDGVLTGVGGSCGAEGADVVGQPRKVHDPAPEGRLAGGAARFLRP